MVAVKRDCADLLSAFNAVGVEYLSIGAHALAAHGHLRTTRDLQVWVRPEAAHARREWVKSGPNRFLSIS